MLLSLFSNITYYLLLVIPYFSINELFTARKNLIAKGELGIQRARGEKSKG
jgi:hypothetical protein